MKFDPEVNYNISKHYVQNNFLQVFKHETMVIQSVLLKFSDQCHAVGSIHISCLAQFIGHQCLLAGLWRCWLIQDTLMTTVNRNTGYLLRVLVVCL